MLDWGCPREDEAVKRCSVKGCYRRNHARGYCRAHYARWRYGRPDSRPIAKGRPGPPRSTPAALFERNVNRDGGPNACHVWTGSLTADGYGRVRVGDKVTTAHRLALELSTGRKIEEGRRVKHACATPSCVNVKHLRPS